MSAIMRKKFYTLMVLLIFFISPFLNAQFYVSPTGDDANNGSVKSPFRTVNGALYKIAALRKSDQIKGDVDLIVKKGEYYLSEPLIISPEVWDGRNTLTIKGEKRGKVTLNGGIKLPNFRWGKNNLWEADIHSIQKLYKISPQQIFVNDSRAIRARTPNKGFFYKISKTTEIPLKSSGTPPKQSDQVIVLDEKQSNTLKNIQDISDVVISLNHKWNRTRSYLNRKTINSESVTLNFETPVLDSFNKFNTKTIFFLENSMSFLDEAGEWFIDKKGVLYYYPRAGESIKRTFAEIPLLDQLLLVNGQKESFVKNIVIKDIIFKNTKYTMPSNGDGPDQGASATSAAISLNFTDNIIFTGCEIKNIANNAIWFEKGCTNGLIENCYIHDIGIGGIKIGPRNIPTSGDERTEKIVVRNNVIHSGGNEIPTGPGIIIFQSGNNTIVHNDIADFRYTGISVGWTWGYTSSLAKNNLIGFNKIHHLGWNELSDMGGIYSLGPSNGTKLLNNVIHDIYSFDYGGWGLYTDEGSTDILIENNLVYNCKNSGFHQHYGKDNIVRNNIFANQFLGQLEATLKEKHLSFTFTNNIIYFNRGVLIGKPGWDVININSNHNLYWDTRTKDVKFLNFSFAEWKNQTGKDSQSIIEDPLFVNPPNFDFRFKNTKNIRKIGFVPFQYSDAGILNNNVWKDKAKLDPQIIANFKAAIKRNVIN
ncbi:MAG: hypothetical protein BGO34_05140 [Bacteroidia bacterium 44-10]|nr:MAG: hypothetical protein BGO34_05140 [Bacteroidia bacterium 44-10]